MTHAGYILAAYLATAIVLVGLVLWVTIDIATQRRRLRQLEEGGPRRASRSRA